jgi:hypothetical protein
MQHANHLFDRINSGKDGNIAVKDIEKYLTRQTSMAQEQVKVLSLFN